MKKIIELLFKQKEPKISLLALSIHTFTEESQIAQIFRQGRFYEYRYKARYLK
jgi:hypothetical protein